MDMESSSDVSQDKTMQKIPKEKNSTRPKIPV